MRPITCRRTTSPTPTTAITLFTIADDIVRLRERVIRLKDPNCHAEYPLSRTRRLIGNVRITGVDGDVISVAANFIIHRYRHNELDARLRRPATATSSGARAAGSRSPSAAPSSMRKELGLLGSVSFIL